MEEDKDFVPNEYSSEEFAESDDEDTLAEEERLAAENPADINEELNELANEADLPIEELIAKYGYNNKSYGDAPEVNETTESEEDEDDIGEEELDTHNNSHLDKNNGISKSKSPDNLKRKSISPSPKKDKNVILENNVNKKVCQENGDAQHKDVVSKDGNKTQLLVRNYSGNQPSTSHHKGLLLSPNTSQHSKPYESFYHFLEKSETKALLAYSDETNEKDDSSDEEYQPIEAWKKQIKVGKEYQADVFTSDFIEDENERQLALAKYAELGILLWNPYVLPESKVKHFLIEVNKFLIEAALEKEKEIKDEQISSSSIHSEPKDFKSNVEEESMVTENPPALPGSYKSPKKSFTNATTKLNPPLKWPTKGANIHDNPDALYLLMKCAFDVEEALRKIKQEKALKKTTPKPWTDDDCLNFETGLQIYNKDFHKIHTNCLPQKSVGELVQFYYFWKKSQRHDLFAARYRIEKKQYTLHPGITEFMDRLVEETTHTNNQYPSATAPPSESVGVVTDHGQPAGNKLRIISAYETQGRDIG